MVIDLTPEEEAVVLDAARHEGTSVEQVVKNALLWFARSEEANYRSIQRGIEQADRGEFVSEEEMERRFSRMMQPR